jgi:hypothetical protein
MANTCTICRHKDRERIEDALASGQSLRNIAKHFDAGYSNINRHQSCIAAELQALKAGRAVQRAETFLQRLTRYRLIAEKPLEDEEKALLALDRCFKLLDIEAKLTGAYQKKQENQPDRQRRDEVVFEAYKMVLNSKNFDEFVSRYRAFYDAPDESARDAALRSALEADTVEVEAVWEIAEQRVTLRESTMIH